jgi:predicted nucleotidyltransferase component of viral defense system
MLKVWNPKDHRATMDIDLLAQVSNKLENLKHIIHEVSQIRAIEDALMFNHQKLILRPAQVGGEYEGISASFSTRLDKTQIPILVDIGFNDFVIPKPRLINYPTLLNLPSPKLMGYTPETVIAEKLESIVKFGLFNTRMKDFYDIWTILKSQKLNPGIVKQAINEVFSHRNTKLEYPISFSEVFYNNPDTMRRWDNFLSLLGKEPISLHEIIAQISNLISPLIEA